MICGFMGTVIGIERAVAVKQRFAFAAPAARRWRRADAGRHAGGRGAGWPSLAAVAFIAVNVAVVCAPASRAHRAAAGRRCAWLVGNLLFAARRSPAAVVPWWFAFLVLTIAAERLEMTRLMRRRHGAAAALLRLPGSACWPGAAAFACVAGVGRLAVRAVAGWRWPPGWSCFDIARRTVARRRA